MDETDGIDSGIHEGYQEALEGQVKQTIARRIRVKVHDARSDLDRAARRWPFELIQNAHDAGARHGRDGITVALELRDGVLRFKHDAAPFRVDDIAALLTGGSSKDFDSHETTGRFGTGFLVTHALSERAHVGGILQTQGGNHRGFDLTLDRPDDEALILRNIEDCEAALKHTRAVDFSSEPTLGVKYVVDHEASALAGLDMLQESLPHLFASCPRLRQITIQRGDNTTHWRSASPTVPVEEEDMWIKEFPVDSVTELGEASWRVIQAAPDEGATGWLLLALTKEGDSWTVAQPGQVPSVFRQLPVLGAPRLSAWVVIDGDFDLDEERASVHVSGDHGVPLREALAGLEGLALFAQSQGWKNGFRVAQLGMPNEPPRGGAGDVWQEVLYSTARVLAGLPLVETTRRGVLPASTAGEGETVDFIPQDGERPNHGELWQLVADCTAAAAPVRPQSEGWSEIAEGWEGLGVPVYWMGLQRLGDRASHDARTTDQLAVDCDPYDWLGRYMDAVGMHWRATGGMNKEHLEGLLPDQHGELRGFGELRRDGGVSGRVKEIAEKVGVDLRAQLLDEEFEAYLVSRGWEGAVEVVSEGTGQQLTEERAVAEVMARLEEELPDGEAIDEEREDAAEAGIALLEHLSDSQGSNARNTALKVPLWAADGTARLAGPRRLMLPPVAMWDATARPFVEAYPSFRVLSDKYASVPVWPQQLLESLWKWGIAHEGLITVSQRDEIRDLALRSIAEDTEAAKNGVLRQASMKQISMLEPEVINHVKQSRERAQALLGLVVRFVAPNDDSWRSTVELTVRTPGGDKMVDVTPSLWLADMRSKPWIPLASEDDVTHHIPSPELLRDLVDPSWLEANPEGAELLVRHFEMDALDVRLLGAAKDEDTRQRLRDSLARIVQATGDAQMLENLATKAENQERDVGRMRNLGMAVQEGVKLAMEGCNLRVDVVDHGYDFLVSPVEVRQEDPEDLSAEFRVGETRVEVKASTTNEVHLTPLQAMNAVKDPRSFMLCVVDLRNFPGNVHKVDWRVADVSGRCRLVSGEALPIDETLTLVNDAEASDVPIRNVAALRYAASAALWEGGEGLEEWVRRRFGAE